ncbi:type II secretion system protein GspM [Aquicella siphonis]|nr:type II secretion system protein M [Aquicella siphonis]
MKAKEWWMSLAARERQAMTAAGALLVLFIIYQWIWSPYLEYVNQLRKRIASDQETLVWMQAADQEIQKIESQSKGKAKSSSPVALLSQIQKQINQAGLDQSLSQLKQASNDSIEVHFQKVDFEKLMTLLVKILKEQSVSVTQFSVTASDETTGIVNADMIIKLS